MRKKLIQIEPRLLRPAEAAQYLSTTVWAIRRLQWAGQLRGLRLGHRLLFDVKELDRFVDELDSRGDRPSFPRPAWLRNQESAK